MIKEFLKSKKVNIARLNFQQTTTPIRRKVSKVQCSICSNLIFSK